MVLAEIEKQTGHPVAELFDLIAGTDCGGMLAAMLTRPATNGTAAEHRRQRESGDHMVRAPKYSAQDLVDAFKQDSKQLYPSLLSESELVFKGVELMQQLARHTPVGAMSSNCPKYPGGGMEKFFSRRLEDCHLRECLTDVLVPCYEMNRRAPFFFSTQLARAYSHRDFPLATVARAAMACPSYFPPVRVKTKEPGGPHSLVDGCLYANNPAMCAYVEAKEMCGDADILMVSLGTGMPGFARSFDYGQSRLWNAGDWLRPVMHMASNGLCDTVDHQLRKLMMPADREAVPAERRNYYRFQMQLTPDAECPDNVSYSNMRRLELSGQALVSSHQAMIKQLCERLLAEKGPGMPKMVWQTALPEELASVP
jgi:predicted acylesterase/phospholipase RssA